MRDHSKLVAHWNAATGGMAERLATINALTESGPRQAIALQALRDVLVQRGRWRALEIHALMGRTADLRQRLGQPEISVPARAAAYLLQLVNEGGTLQVGQQFSTLQKLLNDLKADGMLEAEDVAALWALSETQQEWWRREYKRPIDVHTLIEAQLVA
jgi:hypothetical protein